MPFPTPSYASSASESRRSRAIRATKPPRPGASCLRNAAWFVLFASVAAGADQLAKWWIFSYLLRMEHPRLVLIPGLLSLTAVEQTGAAFGLFRGHNLVLAIVSALAIIVLGAVSLRTPRRLTTVALATIAGGAAGNLVDRIALRHIRDFIDFGFWPVFNLADVAICVGAAILALNTLLQKPTPRGAE